LRLWRLLLSGLGVALLLLGGPAGWPPGTTTTALAESSNTGSSTADVALGVIVDTTNPRSMQLAHEAGFTHAKMIVQWPRLEPKKGQYTFSQSDQNDLDNVIRAADDEDLKLVLRVDGAPDWAGGKPSKVDTGAVEAFYAAMAAHGKGVVTAYEILNEPNLPFEWGGDPSPSGYVAFLKAAYKGVKKGDPGASVIGGGLSPATGGAGGTIEDVDFLRGMYAAGARGSMDAMAIHNYGGNHEPEQDPGDCGICFRRAEIYRQIMVDAGDSATPVWATEFGWLMDPGKNMGQYDWMRVSADKQAEYVVRSFKYARANWPWMTGLLLSNLDASTTPYHTGPQDGMPWFAILNKDYSPRPAWKAIKSWREGEGAVWATKPQVSAATDTGAAASNGSSTGAASVQPAAAASPAASPTPDMSTLAAQAPTPSPEPTQMATPESSPVAAAAPAASPAPSSTTAASDPGPVTAGAVSTTRLRIGKTEGTGANLRARPTSDGKVLAILMDGTGVDIVGEDVKAGTVTWRNVRTVGSTTDGVTGWVSAQYLVP
jgi:hypothetical protein